MRDFDRIIGERWSTHIVRSFLKVSISWSENDTYSNVFSLGWWRTFWVIDTSRDGDFVNHRYWKCVVTEKTFEVNWTPVLEYTSLSEEFRETWISALYHFARVVFIARISFFVVCFHEAPSYRYAFPRINWRTIVCPVAEGRKNWRLDYKVDEGYVY